MKNRTQDEWRELFKEQADGNLSVALFCKEHSIGQSCFYKRKSDLTASKIQPRNNSFIKVKTQQSNTTPVTSIKLQYQQTRLSLPLNISPKCLAEFIKALYWDETGFCLWYKRLEKDKFKWPRKSNESTMSISETQWAWLLSGLDLTKMQTHQALSYEAFR